MQTLPQDILEKALDHILQVNFVHAKNKRNIKLEAIHFLDRLGTDKALESLVINASEISSLGTREQKEDYVTSDLMHCITRNLLDSQRRTQMLKVMNSLHKQHGIVNGNRFINGIAYAWGINHHELYKSTQDGLHADKQLEKAIATEDTSHPIFTLLEKLVGNSNSDLKVYW